MKGSQQDPTVVKEENNKEKAEEKVKSEQHLQMLEDIESTQKFIAQFADKSQVFFNHNLLQDPMPLFEKLWKSQAALIAMKKYRQFNRQQVNRLVDRDWGYMNQADRLHIATQFLNLQHEEVNAETLRLEYEIQDQMEKCQK